MKSLLVLGLLLVLLGACVTTQFEKSVTVRKDADGNVVETVETESVIQPNQWGTLVKFKYLKGVQSGMGN